MSTFTRTLAVVCAIGAAVNAGVFFTFSTFTMRGLERLSPPDGARAMQAINKEAPTPPLMILMFCTGLACAVLGVRAVIDRDAPGAWYQIVAVVIFVVGVIALTGLYHVPRNDALDAVDPDSADGIAYWGTYLREWVRMNHVRTIAPLASSILLTLSLTADGA